MAHSPTLALLFCNLAGYSFFDIEINHYTQTGSIHPLFSFSFSTVGSFQPLTSSIPLETSTTTFRLHFGVHSISQGNWSLVAIAIVNSSRPFHHPTQSTWTNLLFFLVFLIDKIISPTPPTPLGSFRLDPT